MEKVIKRSLKYENERESNKAPSYQLHDDILVLDPPPL